MKRPAFFLSFLAFLFITLFISGCFEYEETLHIKRDGSGTITVQYTVNETMLNLYSEEIVLEINKDSVEKAFGKNKGCKLNSVKTVSTNSNLTLTAVISFDRVENIPRKWVFEHRSFEYKVIDNKAHFRTLIHTPEAENNEARDLSIYQNETLSMYLNAFRLRFNVILPAPVLENEPAYGDADSNRVSWTVPLTTVVTTPETVLTAVTGPLPFHFPVFGLILLIAALIAGSIIFVTWKASRIDD